MENTDKYTIEQTPTMQTINQPARKPDDVSALHVRGHIKIFDPETKEVFIDKKVGAFSEWRKLINDWLSNTQKWATKPEECYRLMTEKPIEEGYIMSPYVMSPLFDNKK